MKTKWSDLMADFTAGKCDIAMGGISVTLERQKRAFFSAPYLVNGKAPIARCADKDKFGTLAAIDRPEVTVIVNPGGTNERFVRGNLKQAKIEVFPDNVTIFDQVLSGKADLMVAESIEVKLQEKLRPGLCAINPDQPLQYGEMGYLCRGATRCSRPSSTSGSTSRRPAASSPASTTGTSAERIGPANCANAAGACRT